ncbi:MAG: hypothetical protein K2W33_16550 [Burkholderiales bacterium]|nr:hypothetical protein [Burkholderiales bacterium]
MDMPVHRTHPASGSELLAAAAHLHVQMRRLTGRVTDTEWMVASPAYARAMIQLAREKAQADGHTGLLQTADRLDALMQPPPPPAQPISRAPAEADLSVRVEGAMSVPASVLAQRYVGRLR